MTSFDYVIVGRGTAGCVLANRLSEDPACRVLLIEAGDEGTRFWVSIPAGFSKLLVDDKFNCCASTPSPSRSSRTARSLCRGAKVLAGQL